MTSLTEQRPAEVATDALDATALFPEAHARRRRLRRTIAIVVVVLIAIAAVAANRSGLIGGALVGAARPSRIPLGATPQQLRSVLFTETRQVAGSQNSPLFDASPLVKMVVDTTLGSGRATSESRSYSTSWARRPSTYVSAAAIEKDGVVLTPNSFGQMRICTRSATGRTTCSNTTKPWIELQTSQLRRSVAAPSALSSQSRYDPTTLYAELRSAIARLQRGGTAKVGGVMTTEFHGSLPAQNAQGLRSLPPAEATVLGFAVPEGGSTTYGGPHGGEVQTSFTNSFTSVPIEIWVDQQGYVRQVRLTEPSVGFALRNRNQQRIIPLVVTLDYSDFNKRVSPANVPAEDVYVVHGRLVSRQAASVASTVTTLSPPQRHA